MLPATPLQTTDIHPKGIFSGAYRATPVCPRGVDFINELQILLSTEAMGSTSEIDSWDTDRWMDGQTQAAE